MISTNFIFIGNKKNPSFMIEIIKEKHMIIVYRPDKYSKKITDFFDYYYLGETFEVKYEKLFYKKNDLITFTKSNNESQVISEWLSEILIRTETNYILINTEIQETVDI